MKVFLDSANINDMLKEYPVKINGFTTNPTLIYNQINPIKNFTSGLEYTYESWVKDIIPKLKEKYPDGSISLEVVADDIEGMIVQGQRLDEWSEGYAYVKVPVTTTKGESTKDVVRSLSYSGIKVNLTAVFTYDQVCDVIKSFDPTVPAIISVFAGRIYDAGIYALKELIPIQCKIAGEGPNKIELLWASPRQVYDYRLAENIGCHIITMTPDLINKIPLLGKDLNEFSLDTVKMFYNDAQKARLTI